MCQQYFHDKMAERMTNRATPNGAARSYLSKRGITAIPRS